MNSACRDVNGTMAKGKEYVKQNSMEEGDACEIENSRLSTVITQLKGEDQVA